ncbi:MAG: 4Fe-4S dicluster domain-containing protein [Desulfobacterales bacterium]|jgi:molybdopterin-containing oxidoreductase family iron-sulfur binding subunit
MNRRTFLKIAGIGSAFLASGCSDPQKYLFSLVEHPDDMVTGQPTWYATTCRECPAGCGVLAKNREGRVVKLEGNPDHPVNRGALCMRGQAAVQAVYHPDRLTEPLLKEGPRWKRISFSDAEKLLAERVWEAAERGPGRIRMLTETVGDSMMALFTQTLGKWRSGRPVVFEPFAYESLRAANEMVFGIDGLFSYRIDEADVLVSFGADFMETWLSPVEYARKFKKMHAFADGEKGIFFSIGPYQSLTSANADMWIGCHPGGEAAVALGLVREALESGRGTHLRDLIRETIFRTAKMYTPAYVTQSAGVDADRYQQLIRRVLNANRPLILGTRSGDGGPNDLHANLAVNLLNTILDPSLSRIDFSRRHRAEISARRDQITAFFQQTQDEHVELLLLHQTNPLFHMPAEESVKRAFARKRLFKVSFSAFLDETSQMADLVFPIRLPLECWDEYEGASGFVSLQQPAAGKLIDAPAVSDLFLRLANLKEEQAPDYRSFIIQRQVRRGRMRSENNWLFAVQAGGFKVPVDEPARNEVVPYRVMDDFHTLAEPTADALVFAAAPSIRFFDGRGANRPWLAEIPDPLTKVAWQTPVLVHPDRMRAAGLTQGQIVRIQSRQGNLEAIAYESEAVRPNLLLMSLGQGHTAMGRYARNVGENPLQLLPPETDPRHGGPLHTIQPVSIYDTGLHRPLAHTDGSRTQHDRKIALTISMEELAAGKPLEKTGLTMNDFPMTLPLPEGYDSHRDFYPPHDHKDYRWAMTVDLDRCIGCGACSAACYAENNLGIVGEEQIINGREMSWIRIERYLDPVAAEKVVFFPMLCQHCDNAPCESVCPVYAPHHSEEGINNQIYNRCIGTRFCAQNCPYKVRRFNWFTWQWPEPLNLQLNPDVTVRSKGVMEKCSFCIQRIKDARNVAKNENRLIADGEVTPACVQTCPTGALVFGNLMDRNSRVRKLVDDSRAYQAMGYLNTKPAVIYLKKVVRDE